MENEYNDAPPTLVWFCRLNEDGRKPKTKTKKGCARYYDSLPRQFVLSITLHTCPGRDPNKSYRVGCLTLIKSKYRPTTKLIV